MTGDVGEHYNDLRAARRQAKRQQAKRHPTAQNKQSQVVDPERCYDWIIQSGTNYARDRAAFTKYIPIEPVNLSGPFGSPLRVVGVGMVKLKVLRNPSSTETSIITLNAVLHIPSAICNGVRDSDIAASARWKRGGAEFFDEHGQQILYTKPFSEGRSLMKVALAGNPRGVSPLEQAESALLSCFLSDEDVRAINRAVNVAVG